MRSRPHLTVVLAMSADGKIADYHRSPARFGSPADLAHLEHQVAQADGVLFGAGTLRAYGTTLSVRDPDRLQWRQQQGKAPQPVQIVCSRLAQFDRTYRFFTQPVPRWLLTTAAGAKKWQMDTAFDRIVVAETTTQAIDLPAAFSQFTQLGLAQVVILGGGDLVGSLFSADLVDDLWLTVCPLILGGWEAPTPVAGRGFLATVAPRLTLLEVRPIGQEVFLHYRVNRGEGGDGVTESGGDGVRG